MPRLIKDGAIIEDVWRAADAEGAALPGVEELEQLTRRAFLQLWPAHIEPDIARLEQAVAQARTVWDTLHDENAQILELERDEHIPYEHDGIEHSIHAKIDRIDLQPSGAYRVIDYKTGYPKQDLLEPKKTDLQMGIYAMALSEIYNGDISGSDFEYWLLQDGSRGRIGADDLDLDKIKQKIDNAIEGIQRGQWPKLHSCTGSCAILDDCIDPDMLKHPNETGPNSPDPGASSGPGSGTP